MTLIRLPFVFALLAFSMTLGGSAIILSAGERQPHDAPATAQHAQGETKEQPHGAGEADHGESVWPLIARIANFAILAGALVYFLRPPIAQYLSDRSAQIRHDLASAAETRKAAVAQLAQIQARLQALPGELDALRVRGAAEVQAEDARIRQAAETERQRLLDQTRREIDLQVRVAKGELLKEAAALAVGLASERIKQSLTADDHRRLIDRYLEQVSPKS